MWIYELCKNDGKKYCSNRIEIEGGIIVIY